MKRLSLILLGLFLWACDSNDDTDSDPAIDSDASISGEGQPLRVWIEPLAEGLLSETISVEVGCEGAVQKLQLLVDDVVVAETEEMGPPAQLSWDTTSADDGARRLVARAVSADEGSVDSDAVTVSVDNDAPLLTFEMPRLPVLTGPAYIPFQLEEAHPAEVQVIHDGQIVATTDGTSTVVLDTTQLEDGIQPLSLKAVDALGREVESAPVEFVIVNNGKKANVQYLPGPVVEIPEDYQSVDYHTRVMVPSEEGVRRILTWLTWDNPEWELEYAMGQGTCPHRGITYITEGSADGEVIIDLAKEDIPSSIQMSFSPEQRESESFPVNSDPATFGSFFGHINPLDPADHLEQSIPVEVNMVLFY